MRKLPTCAVSVGSLPINAGMIRGHRFKSPIVWQPGDVLTLDGNEWPVFPNFDKAEVYQSGEMIGIDWS